MGRQDLPHHRGVRVRTAVPPGNVLVALARFYGVPIEDLCSDEVPPLGERQRERLAALLDLGGR